MLDNAIGSYADDALKWRSLSRDIEENPAVKEAYNKFDMIRKLGKKNRGD